MQSCLSMLRCDGSTVVVERGPKLVCSRGGSAFLNWLLVAIWPPSCARAWDCSACRHRPKSAIPKDRRHRLLRGNKGNTPANGGNHLDCQHSRIPLANRWLGQTCGSAAYPATGLDKRWHERDPASVSWPLQQVDLHLNRRLSQSFPELHIRFPGAIQLQQ